MITYFGGAEVPVYRELMHERGVIRQSLNFVHHYRRVKGTSWSLDEHFPADSRLFLDSGARTYNRPGVEVSLREIESIANDYYAFVAHNLDRIDGYLEFDAVQLLNAGEVASIEGRRLGLDLEKGIVVWHAADGLEELERLCSIYPRVAVSEKTLDDDSLLPAYRRLARTTKLHLIGADRSLMIPSVAWHSCHFSAWISAQQRGETFVWAGHQLRRYDASQKEVARRRHRELFESLGFSAEKIAADDSTENLKLALWSWQQHFASLERPVGTPVTRTLEPRTLENPSQGLSEVDGTHPEWEHDVVTARALSVLPGRPYLGDEATGAVYSKDQRSALYDSMIEIQAQRMFDAREKELRDGGYLDKEVSAEIALLGRLLKVKDDMEQAGFSITVKAQQRGEAQTGLLSRLFGRDAEPIALPADKSPEAIAVETVVDAEIISDTVTR